MFHQLYSMYSTKNLLCAAQGFVEASSGWNFLHSNINPEIYGLTYTPFTHFTNSCRVAMSQFYFPILQTIQQISLSISMCVQPTDFIILSITIVVIVFPFEIETAIT